MVTEFGNIIIKSSPIREIPQKKSRYFSSGVNEKLAGYKCERMICKIIKLVGRARVGLEKHQQHYGGRWNFVFDIHYQR